MGLKERLLEYISYKGISKAAFEKNCGLSNDAVGKMGNNTSIKTIDKISKTYPELNIAWLRMGVGEMITSEEVAKRDGVSQTTNQHGTTLHTIKYYPAVNGSMGGVEFLDNPNEVSTDIVIPGFSDCKFAVNAYGDSMYPIIKSGQIVVMMEWKESFIDWGRIYFVVTKNGYRAIKYLRPSDKEGYIKCVSENSADNPEFDIEINDIHKLFLVKGWICREAI